MTHKHTMLCAAIALCFLPMLAMAESPVATEHKAPPAISAEAREAWQNMTPEQRQAKRAEMKAQRQKAWEALSPEEKAAKKEQMNAKWRDKWQNMTPEQKAAHKAKAKERWDAMPAEKQAEIKEKMAERHMMKRKFKHNQKMKAAE